MNINDLIKEALKSGDKERLATYRLIKSEFQKYEAQGTEFKIDPIIEANILRTMIKQREKSIQEYKNSGRLDLAENETREINIISEFLPKEPTDEEIYAEIMSFMGCQDITSVVLEKSDMGKVMAHLKTKLPTASGKRVSELVRSLIK